jgi:hypothetical protein
MFKRSCIATFFLLATMLFAQRKVDPRLTYVRVIAVVPHVGTGSSTDPKRPQYAPAARTSAAQPVPGIIGFTQQISDDGKWALVEYVARDMASLQPILNDKTIKTFVKGKDKKSDIELELKRFKKDFDLDKFGLVMP